MLNPQLLHHLEAFEEEKDRTGTTSAEEGVEEGRRGAPFSPRRFLTFRRQGETASPPRWRTSLLECSGRILSSFIKPEVQVAAALLGGVSLATVGLGISWNLSVASFLIWTFLKARRSERTEEDPTVQPRDARILESRRRLSTLLASVGAPPLSLMHPMAEDGPSYKGTWRQPALDGSPNLSTTVRDDDADRVLDLLERFTYQHVALIGRVDELVEWIRDATALRFLGTGRAPTPSRGPSVERVERSAASKLVRQRAMRQNDANTSATQQQQPALTHTLESLPLASLRRNIAVVGLQQLQALCFCLRECEHTPDENELNDDSNYRELDVPDVVTLSWIRSLRSDLVHALYCIVEATVSDLMDCDGQPTKGIDGANYSRSVRPSHQAMHRAVSAAEEGLSFLHAYPHSGVVRSETSTMNSAGSEIGADLSWRLNGLQNQCEALTTALLTLQESICAGSYSAARQDYEPQRWWTLIRDLSSQISVEVEALDSDWKLLSGRDRQDGASSSNSPPDDDHPPGQAESSYGSGENEYVLVDSSREDDDADGRDQCDGDITRTNRNESRTLVYSGQGSVVRPPKPSLRPTSKRESNASKHHAPLDPALLYQSIYEELRGRLGMIELDEVDASASMGTTEVDDEELCESTRVLSAGLGPPALCGVAREQVSATFLAELRGAMRDDSPITEAVRAWGD
jgi:hypothetical protein